mmetsp:Transcript_50411/g.75348  ORF Transcript_50411/g.75348 Transcript_50411/m.75348 type:complete len:112 (+) Transcript_50411:455-790(+)
MLGLAGHPSKRAEVSATQQPCDFNDSARTKEALDEEIPSSLSVDNWLDIHVFPRHQAENVDSKPRGEVPRPHTLLVLYSGTVGQNFYCEEIEDNIRDEPQLCEDPHRRDLE